MFKSLETFTSADGLPERTVKKKPGIKTKTVINRGKRSKTSNKVKPFENINKNPHKISRNKSPANRSPLTKRK